MLKKIEFAILVIILFCTVHVAESFSNDLDKVLESQKEWQKLKQDCQGNYSYDVKWSSFAGFGSETKISVRDNRVVGREFKTFKLTDGPSPAGQQQEIWAEAVKDLGSHKRGAPPKTLDELYKEAVGAASQKLSENERRYLKFDKQGLLLQCFIVDTRIADDAPKQGVDITSITLGGGAHPGTGKDGKNSIQLTDKDNGKTFKLPVGENILIRLDSNPTTGFSWNNATRSKKLKLSGEIAYQSEGTQLGSGGVSTATFVAAKVGQGKIILEYKRVFEEKPPAKTFSVKIDVVEPTPDKQPETTYQAPNGKKFPVHWGAPPRIQTRDLRPLPGGYGQGSGTLARWIQENLDRDAAGGKKDK